MLSSLEIQNFRCFDRLEMNGLARVNLIVGSNNSGKTALLEAIELWATRGAPETLATIMKRRGEVHRRSTSRRVEYAEYAVRHLFYGREIDPLQRFSISGTADGVLHAVNAMIEHGHAHEVDGYQHRLPLDGDEAVEPADVLTFAVYVTGTDNEHDGPAYRLDLSSNGIRLERSMRYRGTVLPVSFVTTGSLRPEQAFEILGEVVLTEEEEFLVAALRSIEPDIVRVALAGSAFQLDAGRGGVVVKLKGQKQRVPIGSMGDGIWRMLSLALTLVSARGGILLVDEIDTGLHFSVMADMWKMVIETARRLDVQVFATTHSRDCWESLAVILQEIDAEPHTAAIHRIEQGKKRTVVFDEQEIVIAAERHIEVR